MACFEVYVEVINPSSLPKKELGGLDLPLPYEPYEKKTLKAWEDESKEKFWRPVPEPGEVRLDIGNWRYLFLTEDRGKLIVSRFLIVVATTAISEEKVREYIADLMAAWGFQDYRITDIGGFSLAP